MGSFKLRLVTYFMLLSLLPLLAAAWAFSEVAKRGETGSADSRLSTALRVAVADYVEQVSHDATDPARSLARAPFVQRALATHNRSTLVRTAREVPHTGFYVGGRFFAGEKPPRYSVTRSAQVVLRNGDVLGEVKVSLPLDDGLVRRLSKDAGLEEDDRFVLVSNGRVIASRGVRGRVLGEAETPRYVTIDGTAYRAVGTELLKGAVKVRLLGLTPKAAIDQAAGDLRQRFLLFAAVALLAVGILAYALGRTIVRSLKELSDAAGAVARGHLNRRVPARGRDEFASLGHAFNDMAEQLESRIEELAAERTRVREAISRFGDALAATHDPYALLGVIVESTVEAIGAAGGRLVVDGKEIARAGTPGADPEALAVPIETEDDRSSTLYLTPAEGDFDAEARELAQWLGAQASVALENARLHRLVERQASTDGLTELSNRRHFEEALEGEISRAERFGGRLALIVADLDDFKQVNDRFGHQAGDDVLRTFASVLRETVRDIDLPARYGGEEFAVLLPQTDLEGAERLAERLRAALAARPLALRPDQIVTVTASFGVAAFPEAATPDALFAAADEALYRAKHRGKNCVISADRATPVRAAE